MTVLAETTHVGAWHPVIAPRIAALDLREQLARSLAAHMADAPPVDPDPDYMPRHRRNDA